MNRLEQRRSARASAITHTKDLARRERTDFRLPTTEEAQLTEAFQLSLGRLNELDLQQVNLFDAEANEGRRAFLDPVRGRCNVCRIDASDTSR